MLMLQLLRKVFTGTKCVAQFNRKLIDKDKNFVKAYAYVCVFLIEHFFILSPIKITCKYISVTCLTNPTMTIGTIPTIKA